MPEYKQAGSSVSVESLAFDAATTEGCQWQVPALLNYGSGNITGKVRWYSDTETANGASWGVTIERVTAAAALNLETGLAWNTEALTVGTASSTAHGPVETTCTVTSLDSLANGDMTWIRLRRKIDEAGDNMSGDGQFTGLVIEYSDT